MMTSVVSRLYFPSSLKQLKFLLRCRRDVIPSRYLSDQPRQGRQRQQFLSGIRVLDLSRILAGPYCSMILADMGAEVIKIERPDCGDDTRTWGPPFCHTESTYFLSINRNKKSLAIDLKTEDGKNLIKKLACVSDVFLENFLPGKLSELGLGYEELSNIAPHLIYCSITGYGQGGPYADRPGYDVIVAGVGGLIHSTGPQVASLVNLGSNYLNAGKEAVRHGTAHESIVPYQSFATSDGYILIGAGNNKQFKALCKILDINAVSEDERYKTNELRVANRKPLISHLSKIFRQKSSEEWLKELEGCGFPYGPINNMSQVFADKQVQECGLVQEIEHPLIGKIHLPAPAVDYSSECSTAEHIAPPLLGQHSKEVLHTVLGMKQDEIDDLITQGVISSS